MARANANQAASRPYRAAAGEGDRLRVELVDAAEQLLLSADGDEALTIRAVSAKVGVTSPSVYLHFANKAALIDAVCLRAWESLEADLEAALHSRADPFQGLRALGGAYTDWALSRPRQYRLVLREHPSPDGGHRRVALRECLGYLTEAVRPCVAAGVMLGDPEQLALRMWGALHGFVALRQLDGSLPWPDDDEAFGENVARMAGIGSALLSRMEADPPERPPTSEAYRRVLDVAVERLREAEPESDRQGGGLRYARGEAEVPREGRT